MSTRVPEAGSTVLAALSHVPNPPLSSASLTVAAALTSFGSSMMHLRRSINQSHNSHLNNNNSLSTNNNHLNGTTADATSTAAEHQCDPDKGAASASTSSSPTAPTASTTTSPPYDDANDAPAILHCDRCDSFETISRALLIVHMAQCVGTRLTPSTASSASSAAAAAAAAAAVIASTVATIKRRHSDAVAMAVDSALDCDTKSAAAAALEAHSAQLGDSASGGGHHLEHSLNGHSGASSGGSSGGDGKHHRKLFECDVCNMKFSNGANMRRHKMRHTGVKPYECRVCQKRFFRKDHLAEHFTTHTKTLPYHCPICNRGFQRQIAMRAHFQNEHVGQHELVKTCPLCSYRAGTMKSLRVHFFNRHGIDLDNPGANAPSSLLMALDSQQGSSFLQSSIAAAMAAAAASGGSGQSPGATNGGAGGGGGGGGGTGGMSLAAMDAASAAAAAHQHLQHQHQHQQQQQHEQHQQHQQQQHQQHSSYSDSGDSVRSADNGTPPMHFLTPHVEISMADEPSGSSSPVGGGGGYKTLSSLHSDSPPIIPATISCIAEARDTHANSFGAVLRGGGTTTITAKLEAIAAGSPVAQSHGSQLEIKMCELGSSSSDGAGSGPTNMTTKAAEAAVAAVAKSLQSAHGAAATAAAVATVGNGCYDDGRRSPVSNSADSNCQMASSSQSVLGSVLQSHNHHNNNNNNNNNSNTNNNNNCIGKGGRPHLLMGDGQITPSISLIPIKQEPASDDYHDSSPTRPNHSGIASLAISSHSTTPTHSSNYNNHHHHHHHNASITTNNVSASGSGCANGAGNIVIEPMPPLLPLVLTSKPSPGLSSLPLSTGSGCGATDTASSAASPQPSAPASSSSSSSMSSSSLTSLIKVSPLKSLLREDLKRRISARASNRSTRSSAAAAANTTHSSNSSSHTTTMTTSASSDSPSGAATDLSTIVASMTAAAAASAAAAAASSSSTSAASSTQAATSSATSNGTITSTGADTELLMGGAAHRRHLQCLFCGIEFPDQTLYFLHKGCHSESNPWKCNICGEQMGNVYEFNSHLLSKSHQ